MLNIVNKYRRVTSDINSLSCSRSKLISIIEFFKVCENEHHFPPDSSFIYDFVPIILNIFKTSSVNFINPKYLTSVKSILLISKKYYSNNVILEEVNRTINLININLLKNFFYLGEYEQGITVLKKIVEESEAVYNTKSDKPEENKKYHIKPEDFKAKNTLIPKDLVIKPKVLEVIDEIRYELDRINSFSYDEINTILVEDNSVFGLIQPLYVSINHNKTNQGNVKFLNQIDLSLNSLVESLNKIFYGIGILLHKIKLAYSKQNTEINLFYKNKNSIYKGESFIFAATLVSFCKYLDFRNSRYRFKISGASAFTGSIDTEGNLLKLPDASIESKITTVFFSWVRYVIVPFDNLQLADKVLNKLKIEYPNRELNIIGLKQLTDIFDQKAILKEEKDTYTKHSYRIIRRHFVLSSISFAVIMFIIGLLLAFNFFPKNIKPLPQTTEDYSLIYTPDRKNKWIFNNADNFGGDTIDFGDAAIGDQKFVSIELWNNSGDMEGFNISIEGNKINEFDFTFLFNSGQPEAPDKMINNLPEKLYIKFTPVQDEGKKDAIFVISDKRSGYKKEIYLKGTAKRLNNGYCIDISNMDDALIIEPKVNIIAENTTTSFWIKPYMSNISLNSGVAILRADNNPLTNNKINLSVFPDSSLTLTLFGSKSLEKELIEFSHFGKLKFNEWNYISFSIGDTILSLVLNDSAVTKKMKKGTIRIFDDCISFGGLHPEERTAKNIGDTTDKFFYFLDEVKIYNKYFTESELIKKRYLKDFANENLMLHYTFDDATPKTVFDNTTNDFFGRMYGGVRRIIDTNQPYNSTEKYSSVSGTGNTYLKSSGKGFIKLNKNIFSPNTSFTVQCDVIVPDNYMQNPNQYAPIFYFNRSGLDISLKAGGDSIIFDLNNKYFNYISQKKYYYPELSKWSRFTFTFDYEKNEYCLYVNGNTIFRRKENFPQNIVTNYMGISFAGINYYAAPRYNNMNSYIDNIKIYSKAISINELFPGTTESLLAYWTFEKTDKELTFDEINNLPLIMWQNYELIKGDLILR